jgi:predicted permease
LQQGLNRLAYWVGLPALLFIKIAEARIDTSEANAMLISMAGATLFTLALSFFAGRWMRLPPPGRAAFMHASFRGNLAFIALPIVFFMTATLPESESGPLLDRVILSMAPMVIGYNLVAVPILVLHNPREGIHPFKDLFHRLLTNPLIIACVLGFALNQLKTGLPDFLSLTCHALGSAAFPMALLAIGSHLSRAKLGDHRAGPYVAAMLKTLVTPCAAWFIAQSFGMGSLETRATLIMCASPTAVASYVLTDQLGGDAELNAAAIAVSSLVGFFVFAVILVMPL